MEKKQLWKFTFFDLYWELLKQLENEAAGRFATNICTFMFTDEEIPKPEDDKENFFWSNIIDVLEEDKRIEQQGKMPKTLNKKMRHFTFCKTYYMAFKLMTAAEYGEYIKAICSYMFDGVELKLKPSLQGYFALAKRTLKLSQTRRKVGERGGVAKRKTAPRTEPAPQPIQAKKPFTFEDFMRRNPHVRANLLGDGLKLKENVDWKLLDECLRENEAFRDSTSLFHILSHYREILET